MREPSGLIDDIYEAAFMPEKWRPLLHQLALAVNAAGALFFGEKERSRQWVNSPGLDVLIEGWISGGWHERNERGERLARSTHAGFILDSSQFTEEERRSLPVYTEFMHPNGLGPGAGTAIRLATGDKLLFAVERRLEDGDFRKKDIRYLDSLRPHLARSALIASRLELQRLKAAAQALQMAGLPAAILDSRGQAMAVNELMEQMEPQIRIQAFNRLGFSSPQAEAFFASVVASPDAASRSFPLPRKDAKPPAIVHMIPVRGDARDIFTAAACFLVVTPVDRERVPAADTIQGLFDLSPAEARVAEAIARGLTPEMAAASLGIGRETVRSHIKAILAKSGTSRQGDFVAAIVSMRPPV